MKNVFTLIALFALLTMQFANAQSGPTIGGLFGKTAPSLNRDNDCDTIFSFAHEGLNPSGLAFDGTYLWSNSFYFPDFLYRFDLTGQLIDSLASPSLNITVGDMEFDGTHILLCVEEDGILYKLNPVTGAVVTQYKLPRNLSNPNDPNNFGIAFDGTYLWHTEYNTSVTKSLLYKLDANNGNVLDSFELADADLCIKFINGSLYGISPVTYLLHKIDTSDGHYISTEPWCIGFSLGLAIANNHVWASQYDGSSPSGRIFQFDSQFLTHTNTVVPEIDFALYPNPMADWLHLELRDLPGSKLHIDIVNVLSQNIHTLANQEIVSSDQSLDFDLSQYPNGVYMVKIKTDKAQSLKTFLKQ